MLFLRTLADDIDGKNVYETLLRDGKDVKKLQFDVHPKGAILLKVSGSKVEEVCLLTKGDRVSIINTQVVKVGDMETLNVRCKQKTGYVPINRLLAPSFFSTMKQLVSKRKPQADDRVNTINEAIEKSLNTINQNRQTRSQRPISSLTFLVKDKRFNNISYVKSIPPRRDCLSRFALGKSDVDLSVWFGDIPVDGSLSEVFSETSSFIYNQKFLIDILKKAYEFYTEKGDGTHKLQASVYKILNSSTQQEKSFFQKAVAGTSGDSDIDSANNTQFFVEGDPKIEIVNNVSGIVKLSFSGDLKTKRDYTDIYDRKESCIVLESTSNSSIKFRGKTIRNAVLGLHSKEYVDRLRESIQI